MINNRRKPPAVCGNNMKSLRKSPIGELTEGEFKISSCLKPLVERRHQPPLNLQGRHHTQAIENAPQIGGGRYVENMNT